MLEDLMKLPSLKNTDDKVENEIKEIFKIIDNFYGQKNLFNKNNKIKS